MVPLIMTNSTKDLDPIVNELINLVTKQENTIDGYCVTTVMVVALNQQEYTAFKHLCSLNICGDFEKEFIYYKMSILAQPTARMFLFPVE